MSDSATLIREPGVVATPRVARAVPPVPAIRVERVVVATKQLTLDLSDMTVAQGETIAIIGPNGAGKTTLLEALLGLRTAATLDGTMLGRPLATWHARPALRRDLGVALQRASLPFGLTVADVIVLHRRLYGAADPAIVEALALEPLASKTYEWLSRGERQRLDLLLALGHLPKIAFLDEPFTGLDRHSAMKLHAALRRAERGGTILMACHSALELSLADRAAWIADGRLVALAAPDTLRRELLGDHVLRVKLTSAAAAGAMDARLGERVAARFRQTPAPDELAVFGGPELESIARAILSDEDVLSVEIGRTNLTDLLHRCSSEAARA